MRLLKAQLYELELQKRQEERDKVEGTKKRSSGGHKSAVMYSTTVG